MEHLERLGLQKKRDLMDLDFGLVLVLGVSFGMLVGPLCLGFLCQLVDRLEHQSCCLLGELLS